VEYILVHLCHRHHHRHWARSFPGNRDDHHGRVRSTLDSQTIPVHKDTILQSMPTANQKKKNSRRNTLHNTTWPHKVCQPPASSTTLPPHLTSWSRHRHHIPPLPTLSRIWNKPIPIHSPFTFTSLHTYYALPNFGCIASNFAIVRWILPNDDGVASQTSEYWAWFASRRWWWWWEREGECECNCDCGCECECE
jgi:hypothetical protein